jgi:hypothetical protein
MGLVTAEIQKKQYTTSDPKRRTSWSDLDRLSGKRPESLSRNVPPVNVQMICRTGHNSGILPGTIFFCRNGTNNSRRSLRRIL